MSDESPYGDVPDGCGCAEMMEYMSEYRNQESESDKDPEDDLDVSFLSVDTVDDVPFAEIGEDPILREIGSTPLVLHPENEQIVCKMERENPTLSHKDRLGVGLILGLREMGELDSGQRVVEASSGNTAGGVALAANRLDHPVTIVMRETVSEVKRGFVEALDAEIVTVPDVGHEHDYYYQTVAEKYAQEHDAVYLNQYERELNRSIHYEWTGPELYQQIRGEGVTHIVGAMSTTGILSGIAQYIDEVDPSISVVGADGEQSNLWREFHDTDPVDYDVDVEGLGQWRVTDVAAFEYIDDVISVSDTVAKSRAKHEASDNGLLMGPSSGAAMEVAQDISQQFDDARIVSIVHDGPEQYFQQVQGW